VIDIKTGEVIRLFLKKHRIVLSAVLILLSSVFLFVSADKSFQVDSETLVVDPILMDFNNAEGNLGAFGLGSIDDDDEGYPFPDYSEFLKPGSDINEDNYTYWKYPSQIGLQGFVFRGIAHVVRTTAIIGILRFLCCMILVTVLYFIAANSGRIYGGLFAVAFWFVLLTSPYFINFAPNLYWVEFTWFIPMLLGLLCLKFPEKRKWMYLLFFLAILVKCMCGYEYLSTIMLSGIIFPAAEWVGCKESRRSLFKCVLFSGLSMLSGFVVAAVTHVCIISREFFEGNPVKGLEFFKNNIVSKRTFGNALLFDERIKDSLQASVWDVMKIYLWDSAYSKFLLCLILLSIIMLVFDRLIFKKDHRTHLALVLLQLLSVLSWLILAKSHSFDHRHINFVLFDLGLTQTCLYCILNAVSNHICLGIKKEMKQNKASYSLIFHFVK